MSDDPKGGELLILWRLAAAGGGDWKAAIKPEVKKDLREKLIGSGLVEEVQRSPGEGGRKKMHLSLTERGWQWLAEHLDAPIESRSPAASEVLSRLLARLKAHLDAREVSLGEFIRPAPETDGRPVTISDLSRQIESAYLSASGGKENVRVRLADLREALPDVARPDLDTALLGLATAGRASLYRLDNPLEVEARDRDAVLRTPSGEERHIVYLGGRRG